MFIALVIVSAFLAALLFFSAGGKLAGQELQLATMRKVGFPREKLWLLAMAEIAGGIGLIIGLFWWPLGVAAGIGLVLYFIGAVTAHLRKRDWNIAPPLFPLVLTAAALILRILSA